MKQKQFIPGISALEHCWLQANVSVPQDKQYLMIVLHGRGDSLDSFLSIKEELKIPEMNYLLVNAPRVYDEGFSWYAFEPNQKAGVLRSRERLLKLVSELREFGWAPNRIFLYGFSQGALLSCDLTMFGPHIFAGTIAISGYIYFFEAWKKNLKPSAFQTPWLVTHGIYDDLLPVSETRDQVQKLLGVGLPITWREFLKEHEIELRIETQFIRKWVYARMKRDKKTSLPKSQEIYQTSSSNSKQRFKSF